MSKTRLSCGLLASMLSFGLAGSATAADPFSIVLLPDTQYYSVQTSYDIYDHQMIWINNHKEEYNIKFVIHLGDMTNNNTEAQWDVARSAYDILETSGIPYSVLPGNHDYLGLTGNKNHHVAFRDLARFNAHFGPQTFSGFSWYGGNMGETTTNNENNYCFFEAGGLEFMVLSLEYAPRKDTITWANNLISQHPDKRVIIATHGYMTHGGSYTDGAMQTYGFVGAGGTQLWDELISRHSNVFLAVCGHVTDSEFNIKTGTSKNTIYEMLVDYQFETPRNLGTPNLGNGWLRVLTFNPDIDTVDAFTISVEAGNNNVFINGNPALYETQNYNASYTHSDHLFSFPYDMGPLGDYTYYNASTHIHDFTVNKTGGGDQVDPEIASDEDGNFVVVWEDDHDGNGVNIIRMRGFDSDGNERFSERIVNSLSTNTLNAVNPDIDMAADGRFAVVFQTSNTDIRVRYYNANGTPVSSEFSVTSAAGTQRQPAIAMADDGSFVVAWEDDADGNGSYQIRARGFNANLTQKFAEKTVNSVAAGQQFNPEIAMTPGGDYVVVWQDDQNADGLYEIGVRGFLANETQRFAQFFANSTTTGQQTDADVAIDDSGRFVVTWEDDNDGNGSYQAKARGFSATGGQLFAEKTVNASAGGDQINTAVAMEPGGDWYVVWQDSGVPEGNQMMTQGFTITGTKLFTNDVRANFVANVTNDGGAEMRLNPAISTHKSGRYVVVWADDQDGNGGFQILGSGVPGLAKSLVVRTKNGTVGKSPDETFYKANQVVTLTATPSTGYVFDQWTGDVPGGSSTANPINLTMNTNKNVQAVFVSTNPPPVSEVIVDNNTSEFTASSNWTVSSATSGYYGTDYQWRSTQAISDPAYWNVDLPVSGTYEVFARWTAGGNRSTEAPYLVTHNGGTANVKVNQQINNGTWVRLGTWDFNSGASNKVALSCWAPSGYVVVADAVKFVLQE